MTSIRSPTWKPHFSLRYWLQAQQVEQPAIQPAVLTGEQPAVLSTYDLFEVRCTCRAARSTALSTARSTARSTALSTASSTASSISNGAAYRFIFILKRWGLLASSAMARVSRPRIPPPEQPSVPQVARLVGTRSVHFVGRGYTIKGGTFGIVSNGAGFRESLRGCRAPRITAVPAASARVSSTPGIIAYQHAGALTQDSYKGLYD